MPDYDSLWQSIKDGPLVNVYLHESERVFVNMERRIRLDVVLEECIRVRDRLGPRIQLTRASSSLKNEADPS